MRRLEADARQRNHKEHRDKAGIRLKAARPVAQAGAEAAVGHDAARLRVILHVIRIIVCNNDVRPRAADNVRHCVHDRWIVAVDQHIPDIQVERLLCADDLRRFFKFLRAHRRQGFRLDDHMALIAVRHMAGVDLRALLDIFPKRTPAGDLQIVRVAADCQYSHDCPILF